jgi:hypothetical protein
MITLRPAAARGHANHGWLDSHFSFSFADYHDPEHMGWGALRVINDDWIEPGQGFGRHGHRDMEIVTYVLSGAVAHQDSLGTGSTIRPGEVQRMSAGKGILHSEFNASNSERLHLLQIWIEPATVGGSPSYQQVTIAPTAKRGRLCRIAGPAGDSEGVSIGQNASIDAAVLAAGEGVDHALAADRLAYVHLISGSLQVNGLTLQAGDGAKIAAEAQLSLNATADDTEFLLFDLPPHAD